MVGNPTQGGALDNQHGTGAGCSDGFNALSSSWSVGLGLDRRPGNLEEGCRDETIPPSLIVSKAESDAELIVKAKQSRPELASGEATCEYSSGDSRFHSKARTEHGSLRGKYLVHRGQVGTRNTCYS